MGNRKLPPFVIATRTRVDRCPFSSPSFGATESVSERASESEREGNKERGKKNGAPSATKNGSAPAISSIKFFPH